MQQLEAEKAVRRSEWWLSQRRNSSFEVELMLVGLRRLESTRAVVEKLLAASKD